MEDSATVRKSLVPRLPEVTGLESTASYERFSVRQQFQPEQAPDAIGPSSEDKILTAFIWKEKANSVFVCGSFNGWATPIPLMPVSVGKVTQWIIIIELVRGDYLYRFKVDGEWRIAAEDPNLVHLNDGVQAHWLPAGDEHLEVDEEEILQEEVVNAMVNAREVGNGGRANIPIHSHQTRSAFTIPTEGKKRGPILRALLGVAAKLGIGKSRGKGQRIVEEDNYESNMSPMHQALGVAGEEGDPQVWFPDDEDYERVAQGAKTKAIAGVAPHERANEVNQVIEQDFGISVTGKMPKSHLAAERNAMERQEVARRMFMEGNFDSALALYSLAIKIREGNNLKMCPANVMAHLEMGTTLFHLDDFVAAEQHFRLALGIWQHADQINFILEDKQKLGDLLQFLGVALDVQRRRQEAEYYYRKALEKYDEYEVDGPNVDTCRENLALVRQKLAIAGQQAGTFKPTTKAIHLDRPIEASVTPKPRIRAPPPPPASETEKENDSPVTVEPKAEKLEVKKVVAEEPAPVDEKPVLTQASTLKSAQGWAELAKRARENMPELPLPPTDGPPSAVQIKHEAMVKDWHTKATTMRKAGQFGPASDLFLIAVFARRKQGVWYTEENINMLTEYGKMLLELGGLREADQVLGEAIGILRIVPTHRDRNTNAELYRLYAQVQRGRGRHSLAQHSEVMASRYAASIPRNNSSKRGSILESRESISKELRRAAGLPDA